MGQIQGLRAGTCRWATGVSAMLAIGLGAAGSLIGCASAPPPYEEGVAPVPEQAAVNDPPTEVGRISFLAGQVSFRPAVDTAWAPAVPNRPMTTGDRLWADANSRAEVEGGAFDARISQMTELDLMRLDDDGVQIRLPQGTLVERVKTRDGDDEIDSPNAVIVPSTSGVYRVDVSTDGATTAVTVLRGAADVTAAGSSFKVNAGQAATIQGTDSPTFNLTDAGPVDDFTQWALSRDAREDQAAQARQYVNADVPGAEDLDNYGRWTTDPQYGPIWYPSGVQAGWAPYHYGHWVWIAPWGWTWVDDAPWGYAPFHYGRWALVGGAWGWSPGATVVARPVYAPALVVFVGARSGGSVGWFPLGPNEVYRPAYPATTTYVRRVNVTNVTNVTNITNITNVTNVTNVTYRNRTAPGAVTIVNERAFTGAESIGRVATGPVAGQPALEIAAGGPAVAPTRASLAFRQTPAVVPPQPLNGRPVVALHEPPPAPVSFSQQERILATNGGRPLTENQTAALRRSEPVQTTMLPIRPALAARPTGNPPNGVNPRPGTPQTSPPPARFNPPPNTNPAVSQPVTPRPSAAPLDQSYQSQRSQMEARHQQEFAHPAPGESSAALAQRHQDEHADLQRRYEKARVDGKKTIPPPSSNKQKAPSGKDKRNR